MDITVHLTECDKEPIHLFSKITKGHYLLSICSEEFKILQVSKNIFELLKVEVNDTLNQHIEDILSVPLVQKIYGAIYRYGLHKQSTQSFSEKELHVVVHICDGYFILEIEKTQPKSDQRATEEIIEPIVQNCDIKENFTLWIENILKEIQKISGYDRVLAYQFDKDYNGTVIAQSTHLMHEDFLHHRFPASDIPQQARQLYLKNPFRSIATTDQETVDIVPLHNPKTQQILDMTPCYFRSVSPIHLEYLYNMGVKASMSISLIVNNKLWGLIACHHPKPLQIPAYQFKTFRLLSKIISKQIEQKEIFRHYDLQYENRLKRELFFNRLAAFGLKRFKDFIQYAVRYQDDFLDSDYSFIYYEDQFFTSSLELTQQQMQTFLQIAKTENKELFHCDNLCKRDNELSLLSPKVCGMLWIKVPKIEVYLAFLKKEQIQKINWAGQKNASDTAESLTPRKSFETWVEVVRDTAEPFSIEAIDSAKMIANEFLKFFLHFAEIEEKDRLRKLNKKLQIQTAKDSLTKLYNQRYFYEEGMKYFSRAQETGFVFCIIYIQLYNLEKIKKEFGVDAYEFILVNVANTIVLQSSNKSSIAARTAAHDFALLLYRHSVENVQTIAQNIEKEIAQTPKKIPTLTIEIPLSVVWCRYDENIFENFSDMMNGLQLLAQIKEDQK